MSVENKTWTERELADEMAVALARDGAIAPLWAVADALGLALVARGFECGPAEHVELDELGMLEAHAVSRRMMRVRDPLGGRPGCRLEAVACFALGGKLVVSFNPLNMMSCDAVEMTLRLIASVGYRSEATGERLVSPEQDDGPWQIVLRTWTGVMRGDQGATAHAWLVQMLGTGSLLPDAEELEREMGGLAGAVQDALAP